MIKQCTGGVEIALIFFSGFQYMITVTAEKLFELFVSVCFLQRNLIEPSRHLLCTENRGYNWLKGCSW